MYQDYLKKAIDFDDIILKTLKVGILSMVSKRVKVSQSAFYFIIFIVIGIMSSINGPMLPMLSKNTNVSVGDLGMLFTAGSIGFVITSLLNGHFFDRLQGHKVMFIGFIVTIICMILIPMTPVFSILWAIFLINGISTNLFDLGANTLIVWVHRDNVGPYLNALHFFFGVGATVGPLIVTATRAANGEATAWPFWIVAMAFVPLMMVSFFLPSPKPIVAEVKEGETEPAKVNYTLVVLYAMFLFLYVGGEIGFSNWIFTYATKTGVATVLQADKITSVFWGALTIGRLISIILVRKINALQMLSVNMIGWLVGVLLIVVFRESAMFLWIGTIVLGFFMSSIFPMIFAIAERTVVFTGRVSGLIYAGNSLGGMVLPLLMGKLFENVKPIWIMFVELICALVAMGLFLIIRKLTKDKL